MNKTEAKKAANRLDDAFRALATPQSFGDDMYISREMAEDIVGVVDRLRAVELMLANRMKLDRAAEKAGKANSGLLTRTDEIVKSTPLDFNNPPQNIHAHFAGSTDCGPDCCEAR